MPPGRDVAHSDHSNITYYLNKTTKVKHVLIVKENDQLLNRPIRMYPYVCVCARAHAPNVSRTLEKFHIHSVLLLPKPFLSVSLESPIRANSLAI